jgi:drug/metabolite transporter (DMT)-like permease
MRAIGLIITYYCGIKSIYYAGLANLNFGIVSCFFIFSIIINVACGLLFFDEKINWKESAGIVVIVVGIIWISLSKGQRPELSMENYVEVDEVIQWYKFKSIFLALCVGFFNSTQTVHGKFMMKQKDYGIMNITADTVLIFIIMTSTFTVLNYFGDSTAYTARNYSLIFVSSCLGMI